MLAVTRNLPRRSGLIALTIAGVLLVTPLTAAADAGGLTTSAQADSLWNQPQGTRPDSAFYVIQLWWDGLTRATSRDRRERGLQELSQANADLLNAYTLLQEQRTDPGPHAVAVVDPLLGGAYGLVTGVHIKAPLGSLLGWLNDSLVRLEGRGSSDNIIRNLLSDYQRQRAAANRDLAPGAEDSLWTANSTRETAVLQKIDGLANSSLGVGQLLAAATPASTPAAGGATAEKGKTGGKSGTHGQSGESHGKAGEHQPAKP